MNLSGLDNYAKAAARPENLPGAAAGPRSLSRREMVQGEKLHPTMPRLSRVAASLTIKNRLGLPGFVAMTRNNDAVKLRKLNHYIDSLCGIRSRIARRLGVDRT
jgi:hypothetical protein